MSETDFKKYHWSKTTYELRLKSLWRNSKQWVKNNPLPTPAELFTPLPTSISVTRSSTITNNKFTSTTSSNSSANTTTTSLAAAHSNCTTCTCAVATETNTPSASVADNLSSTAAKAHPIVVQKLSRNKRKKIRYHANKSNDIAKKQLSRRQAKAARKAEREKIAKK